MPAQLFLVTPADPAPDFAAILLRVLDAVPVPALLLRRGNMDDATYRAFAGALVKPVQDMGTAVLIEGSPQLVASLGADGAHIDADAAATRSAISALRPKSMAGAVAGTTMHDAMEIGELEPDYVFFGSLSGSNDTDMDELARWWAATMEIPAVLSRVAANADGLESLGCEFVAISSDIWDAAEGPVAAATAIVAALEQAP